MTITRTIPFRGVITAQIGVAPFQYEPTNDDLYYPSFLNATGLVEYGETANSDGFYGLSSIYASICPFSTRSSGAPTATDIPVQIAGSCISSAGLFDYDCSLANPAEFYAVASSKAAAELYAGTWWPAIYPGGHYIALGQNFDGGGNQIQALIAAPSTLFVSYKAPLSIVTSSAVAFDTIAWFQFQRLAMVNQFGGYQPQFNSGDGIGTAKQYCFDIFTGELTDFHETSLILTPTYFENSVVNSSYSPASNWHLYFGGAASNVKGLAACPGLIFPWSNSPGTPPPGWFVSIALSDDIDNTIISGAGNISIIQTAGGHFLLRVTNTSSYYFIFGDMSGYYRVVLQGSSSAIQTAIGIGGANGAGWGLDLNGNVWISGAYNGSGIPPLYSNLNLTTNLVLAESPLLNLAAGGPAVICSPSNSDCPAEWES